MHRGCRRGAIGIVLCRYCAGPRCKEHALNDPIITIDGLNKTYEGGFQALTRVDLTIQRGEIFALLGPNGGG